MFFQSYLQVQVLLQLFSTSPIEYTQQKYLYLFETVQATEKRQFQMFDNYNWEEIERISQFFA